MNRRHLPLALVAASIASACTVTLPAAPPPIADTQPVFVASGPAGKNPVIQSFTANPTNVTKGRPITFQVVARDPNGEALQYNWSATGGLLSATTGQALMWTPPEKPGVYTVSVTVTNGLGGAVSGSQNLTVQANGAAAIGSAPSTTPTPKPSSLPSASPPVASSAPTSSPVTTPSPSPGSGLLGSLPTFNYTREDCLFDVPDGRFMRFPADAIKFQYNSASNRSYYAILNLIYPHDRKAGDYGGGPAMKIIPKMYVNLAPIIKGAYTLQFLTDQELTDLSREMEPTAVRLKDGTLVNFDFFKTSVPFDRANWDGTYPDLPGKPRYDKNVFVFKFDGTAVDAGIFELP